MLVSRNLVAVFFAARTAFKKYVIFSSTGAHAEAMSGGNLFEVGADATLVRAEGNIGPVNASAGLSLDTHASVGKNGVSASLLGFGFTAGPRLGIKTPICDLNVKLF
jgi:hypothetical protein